MARKTRKSKTKKVKVKISQKVIDAAKEAGFVDKQIENFTDEKALKAAIIRVKPGLALRFREQPELAEPKEKVIVDKEIEFDVKILSGQGPLTDFMRKESAEIERMVKRNGIPIFSITGMTVERNMVASGGRKQSKVIVRYRKEE